LAGTGPNPDVRGIWGLSVPTPTAGNLRYNGSVYAWDGTSYATSASLGSYLPLVAGSGNPLSGELYASASGPAISTPNGGITAGSSGTNVGYVQADGAGSSVTNSAGSGPWIGVQNTTNIGWIQQLNASNTWDIYNLTGSGWGSRVAWWSPGGALTATGTITSNATGTAINASNGNISAQGAASTGGEVIGGTAAIGTANYNSTYGWVGLSGKNGASNATDFGILFDATGSPNLNSSASSSGYILAAGIQEANWNTASFNFTEPVTFNGIVARQSYNRNTSAITGNVTVSTLYSVISLEPGSSNPTTLTSIPNGTVDGQQLTLIQNAPTTCVVSSSNLVATFSLTTGSSRNLTWNNANSKWL
jgi:hypothetical protein